MINFIYLKRKNDEDDWYICVEPCFKDSDCGYDVQGRVIKTGKGINPSHSPLVTTSSPEYDAWVGATVLFKTSEWACFKYETEEELIRAHLEDVL